MIIPHRFRTIYDGKSLRNGILFSGFSFVNQGFGFLLLLILAKYITPGEYGYLSLFNTLLMVVGYFRALSTEGYLSVSYFQEGESGIRNTISNVIFIVLLTTSFLSVSVLFGGDFFSSKLDLPINVLYLTIVISLFTLLSNVNLDYFRIKEQIKLYGIFSCLNALLNFFLSIVLVKGLLCGWEGRVYAQAACCSLFGIIGLFFFLRKGYVGMPDIKHLKTMLLWGVPLIPHLATNFIRQGCDRYIINEFHSIEDVGLFSFAFTLANIIMMIGYGFNQSNSVDIYKVLGNRDLTDKEKRAEISNKQKTFFILYLLSSVAVTIGCFFLIPIILPRYSDSMKYFPILALYGFGVCVYLIYTNFLFYYKKTRTIMYITFFSALLHLGISLLFTRYSLYYTCFAYVITQFLVVMLIKHYANKEINSRLVSTGGYAPQ